MQQSGQRPLHVLQKPASFTTRKIFERMRDNRNFVRVQHLHGNAESNGRCGLAQFSPDERMATIGRFATRPAYSALVEHAGWQCEAETS